MPEVVWAPRERRGLLRSGEGHLARLDPGPPVGDRRQFAAPDAAKQAAVSSRTELGRQDANAAWMQATAGCVRRRPWKSVIVRLRPSARNDVT